MFSTIHTSAKAVTNLALTATTVFLLAACSNIPIAPENGAIESPATSDSQLNQSAIWPDQPTPEPEGALAKTKRSSGISHHRVAHHQVQRVAHHKIQRVAKHKFKSHRMNIKTAALASVAAAPTLPTIAPPSAPVSTVAAVENIPAPSLNLSGGTSQDGDFSWGYFLAIPFFSGLGWLVVHMRKQRMSRRLIYSA